MAQMDHQSRQIRFQVAYFGPSFAGKSTNLRALQARGTLQENEGRLDLELPLGRLRDYEVRFQLSTIPGGRIHSTAWKSLMQGLDGVVFVADSQRGMIEANRESLYTLQRHLETQGLDLKRIPHVLQLNKRDLPDILSVDELLLRLDWSGSPVLRAVAERGEGVKETFRTIGKQVLAAFGLGERAAGQQASFEALPVEALTHILEHYPDEQKRAEAARLLGQQANPSSVTALVRALGDGPSVRLQAVVALGRIATPEAATALTTALKDRSSSVQAAARAALAGLHENDLELE